MPRKDDVFELETVLKNVTQGTEYQVFTQKNLEAVDGNIMTLAMANAFGQLGLAQAKELGTDSKKIAALEKFLGIDSKK